MIHRPNPGPVDARRSRGLVVSVALFVIAGALLALLPAVALAVDTPVVPQSSALVVFIVIILLLGSVTAGIFFASPLRNWLGRDQTADSLPGTASGLSARIGDGLPRMPGGDIYGNEYDAEPRTPQSALPAVAAQRAVPTHAPPTIQRVAPPLNAPTPAANPWSTGDTRPDPNRGRNGPR